jgi:NTP pyrophosphatase (non-canonical NTP hydrolase)
MGVAVVGGPYFDIQRERERAHEKWSANGTSMEDEAWDAPRWLAVLVEEVGEVARTFNEERHGHLTRPEMMKELRTELVQTCAMGCAWIDAIDRGRSCRSS